ncbi:23S rRNA (pseudouridine1915-N3)-methyltransferase [Eilatimonas milleporae]|uniref:Ribosomal RNA large subunit methyltransferase H n=2 Tax=Eilatimonas milleporae TaxID=911205 RepID=A0A3M0CET1_9PROT|nr:23S rRNA (pseudouridine1915-N3)-methyltransferase [Eilatimonas milleporae]
MPSRGGMGRPWDHCFGLALRAVSLSKTLVRAAPPEGGGQSVCSRHSRAQGGRSAPACLADIMRITIIAVGRLGAGPEKTLLDSYVKRLRWPVTVQEIDIRKPHLDAGQRKKLEGERILAAVPAGAAVLALDERGKQMTSPAFAKKIDGWALAGFNGLACIIGGADGLSDAVRDRADLTLALGALTWPHMLVRAMLAEQLYRAWSITAGHPYHRD